MFSSLIKKKFDKHFREVTFFFSKYKYNEPSLEIVENRIYSV